MDLTIDFPKNSKMERLNIRVVVLAQTESGYIFEKHSLGYLYCMGGRIKLNESSLEAASREVFEEIGVETKNLNFRCIIENFYEQNNFIVHEINFVYEISEILKINLPKNFQEVRSNDLENVEIKPNILKKVIKDLGSDNLKTNYTLR